MTKIENERTENNGGRINVKASKYNAIFAYYEDFGG